MCTLIAGVEILGPRTIVLGANRDESPARASAPPGVLRERPRIVGGRDLVAGGTWLAVREARSVTALMNRRPTPERAASQGAHPGQSSAQAFPRASDSPIDPPRSRGLLCLDAAAAGPPQDRAHRLDPGTGERYPERLQAALGLIAREAYAACTLVGLDVDAPSWALLAEAGLEPRVRMLERGWNVVTHAEVNDPQEPRTAWLMERLAEFQPAGVEDAFHGIAALLSTHEDETRGVPGVCLHRERFPTVSSSLIALGEVGRPRYFHAAGPPCSTPYADVSPLLA